MVVASNERKLDDHISYILPLEGLFFTAYGRTVRLGRSHNGERLSRPVRVATQEQATVLQRTLQEQTDTNAVENIRDD